MAEKQDLPIHKWLCNWRMWTPDGSDSGAWTFCNCEVPSERATRDEDEVTCRVCLKILAAHKRRQLEV
jgi:hypothetical protein